MIGDVIALAAELVRIPSQGGVDPPDAIVGRISEWLRTQDLPFTALNGEDGNPLGLFATVEGESAGHSLCVDACIDTAPIGDAAQWTHPPLAGVQENGALWGRGAADSKLGAAILLHLLARFSNEPPRRGTLHVLLDADEHTGGFGGIKAFLDAVERPPDAMVLGYPGHDTLIVGARGFLRCEINVSGKAAHSGSLNCRGVNAIYKAARLVEHLKNAELPVSVAFPLPPSLTVTGMQAGEGFSQVPDKAVIGVDIRLTADFDRAVAEQWLHNLLAGFDAEIGDRFPTQISCLESWPAYQIDEGHAVVQSFRSAGEREFGTRIGTEVCGPSNIGNLLAAQGIATICGLGVAYSNLHAADENAKLADVAAVMRAWEAGARAYLV